MRIWEIQEHRSVYKTLRHVPPWIAKEYEVWKSLIYQHGPEIFRQYPGYHDELLKGSRAGQRSSRLNLKYRVIYVLDDDIAVVYVMEITAHHY